MLMGFGVMLGIIRISRVPKILARILLTPIILGILYSISLQYWHQMSQAQKTLALILFFPIVIVSLLRFILGAELFREVLSHFIYDVLKNGVFAVFWLLGGLLRLPQRFLRALWRR